MAAAVLALCGLVPDAARAFQPQVDARAPREFVAASASRAYRAVHHGDAPPAAAAAYRRFSAAFDPTDIMWDAATRVPLRIWGLRGAVPRAMSTPEQERLAAQGLLAQHIDLLAPGSAPSDFVQVSDDLSSGIHTLGFRQHYHGRPVLGGQLSFRFKAGRLAMIGSEALPHVQAVLTDSPVAAAVARENAQTFVARDHAEAVAGAVDGPFILPIVGDDRVRAYREVLRVIVDSRGPIGKWAVYVDAATGAPVGREQLLRFATGTLQIDAPVRGPAARHLFAAANLGVVVNGAPAVTSINGAVSFADGSPASVITSVAGKFAAVFNNAGEPTSAILSLPPGGTAAWAVPADELVDAQLSGYVHADRVKQIVRAVAPDFGFLDEVLPVNVNIPDICNAFADGETINFFRSDPQCENTARIADVVYHEFGHNVHFQGIIEGVGAFDGALSEGISDFLSATITDDASLAPGFFKGDPGPLRELDPPDFEWHWPEDNGEIHDAGRIIGGALWDLRKALRAKLGAGPGVALVNKMWFESIRRAVDMPSMYPEVLLVDDDDGDLSNGTPNECEINLAFDAHGLVGPAAVSAQVFTGAPTPAGIPVELVVSGQKKACLDLTPLGAELHFRVRGEATSGVLTMDPTPAGFVAAIPHPGDGKVLEYQVRLVLKGGTIVKFPKNPADDRYQLYVGPVTPIFCTGFETTPGAEGWTIDGEWAWGAPQGFADPAVPKNGLGVAGTTLAPPGIYESFLESTMRSPVIDVAGFSTVRLQMFRWLEVEDSTFDRAQVIVNGTEVWANAAGPDGNLHHLDGEWRFQDLDITPFVENDQVRIEFVLDTDIALEFGGWNLDELCVVGVGSVAGNVCGDGVVGGIEACDDGNTVAGDGCSPTCTIEMPPIDPTTGGPIDPTIGDTSGTETDGVTTAGGDKDDGCGCDQGSGDLGAGLLALASVVVLRRRRRV
ncbi:MAG TPA: hypothetical protein VIK91_05880 [Nannocystis sp.]